MKKINKRKIQKYIRMIILLIFFTIMPSIYTTAFSGVKYIFTQIGNGQQVELTSFVTILIVLCLYTIVFGRCFWQFRRLPSGIELPNSGENIQSGECFMCQKCMNICPKQNVKTSTIKGNGIGFILIRAAILIIIMKWAGI